MIKKLRLKFILIVMVIMMGMLAAIFGLLYQSTKTNLTNESLRMIQTLVQDPLGETRPTGKDGVYRPYFCVIQEPYRFDPSKSTYAIRGSDIFVNDDEFVANMMKIAVNSKVSEGIIEEANLRFCRKGSAKTQLTVAFLDMSVETATLSGLVRNYAFIGAGAVPVLLLLCFALSLWMTKPVEKAWQQQRQFISDASHELKTPLTVILTNAELLQEQAQSPESTRRFSANILTMSLQMRSLVERLLDLARADNGTSRQVFRPLDMTRLTADALLPFEPVYFERGLELHCHLQDGIRVRGSQQQLNQTLDILLDNAAKYAMPNSWVQVVLRKQEGHCLLSVATPGETISKADLKNIFKRFYRTDKSRTEGGSYGLGLSIAETFVKEHRGKIWAESSGSINTFFVQLPLTSAQPETDVPLRPPMPEEAATEEIPPADGTND